ncbi:hypothetical protein [Microvirga sp. TS319]|uniref:hypothetical protein n=1 Tax=Microvirga sp. TS319 TaxID=3241165 RepID=UPI00351A8462
MANLKILNLDGERLVRVSNGTPMLIDAGSDVEVVLGDGPLTTLGVGLPGSETTDSLGILLGGPSGVTAPDGISQGKPILVDGVQIGTINFAGPTTLDFSFVAGVTKDQVEQLIKAITYTDSAVAGGFAGGHQIVLNLSDGHRLAAATIAITDNVVGTDLADSFTATGLTLNAGDRLSGLGGDDTLTLTGGGAFNLHLMDGFSGIDTVRGTGVDDEIVIAGTQLGDVHRIDGGGAATQDVLRVTGSADLSDVDIIGFGEIRFGSDGGTLTVGNAELAKLVTGYGTTGDKLTVTGGVLTAQERQALHLRGVDTIVAREVAGGDFVTTTHQAPKVTNFDGNYINAAVGGPVFIDVNRDAVLSVDDGRLKSIAVQVTGPFLLGSVTVAASASLTFSNTDDPTKKNLHYDGTLIGLVEGWGTASLSIGFNADSTASMAQEVLRSLTFVRPNSPPQDTWIITVTVTDLGERRSEGHVHVLSEVTQSLTEGIDNIGGSGLDEIFEATFESLNDGDRIDGGGGLDALQLSASSNRTFDLTLLDSLAGIETIRGSTHSDIIRIGASQLNRVGSFNGGGNDGTSGDALSLAAGTTFDLTWKNISGFERIMLEVDGTQVTTDRLATAQLIDGRSTKNDHLILVGIDLSDTEREAYFSRGIDKITDGSGRTTENRAPALTGVDGDHIRLSAGRSVVIDLESDGTLGAEDDDIRLLTVSVTEKHGAGDTALEIRSGNGITLSAGLDPGSDITVDGVTIGTIATGSDRWEIRVAFTEAATHSLVQKLIRALVYRNTSTDNFLADHDTVKLVLVDEGGRASTAEIDVTITPNIVAFLTNGVDHVVGTGENEVFVAPTNTITAGDTLDGGGGTDTLALGDGPSDLTLFATLTGIEALEGSSDDQTITANAANLAGIATIRGGGGEDRFLLMAGDYDFSGKTIEGVEALSLQGNGTLTFNDRATALLAGAVAGATASVNLTGEAVFTPAERIQLFRQDIASIKDASGTYTNADPDGISLSAATIREVARAGTPIGTLSATDPNQGDTFTYRLLDTAGGRFKLVR